MKICKNETEAYESFFMNFVIFFYLRNENLYTYMINEACFCRIVLCRNWYHSYWFLIRVCHWSFAIPTFIYYNFLYFLLLLLLVSFLWIFFLFLLKIRFATVKLFHCFFHLYFITNKCLFSYCFLIICQIIICISTIVEQILIFYLKNYFLPRIWWTFTRIFFLFFYENSTRDMKWFDSREIYDYLRYPIVYSWYS